MTNSPPKCRHSLIEAWKNVSLSPVFRSVIFFATGFFVFGISNGQQFRDAMSSHHRMMAERNPDQTVDLAPEIIDMILSNLNTPDVMAEMTFTVAQKKRAGELFKETQAVFAEVSKSRKLASGAAEKAALMREAMFKNATLCSKYYHNELLPHQQHRLAQIAMQYKLGFTAALSNRLSELLADAIPPSDDQLAGIHALLASRNEALEAIGFEAGNKVLQLMQENDANVLTLLTETQKQQFNLLCGEPWQYPDAFGRDSSRSYWSMGRVISTVANVRNGIEEDPKLKSFAIPLLDAGDNIAEATNAKADREFTSSPNVPRFLHHRDWTRFLANIGNGNETAVIFQVELNADEKQWSEINRICRMFFARQSKIIHPAGTDSNHEPGKANFKLAQLELSEWLHRELWGKILLPEQRVRLEQLYVRSNISWYQENPYQSGLAAFLPFMLDGRFSLSDDQKKLLREKRIVGLKSIEDYGQAVSEKALNIVKDYDRQMLAVLNPIQLEVFDHLTGPRFSREDCGGAGMQELDLVMRSGPLRREIDERNEMLDEIRTSLVR